MKNNKPITIIIETIVSTLNFTNDLCHRPFCFICISK